MMHEDINGKPRQQKLNCISMIGMMNCLASTSRPCFLFSVHQVESFFSDPKRSHGEAVKRIPRFLKRTIDKRITHQLDVNKPIEVRVDADFTGTWNLEESNLMISALSRDTS